MAELLIRVIDKIGADPYQDAQLTKRGDVIVVCPDGWPWSEEERTNPMWRILAVPDLSISEASILLAPERDTDPRHPSRVLQRRAFHLDLDGPTFLPLQKDLQDATRAQGLISIAVPLTAWRTAVLAKPALSDPAVLGPSPNVIG